MSETMFGLIKASVEYPHNKDLINLMNIQQELDCAYAMYSCVGYISSDEEENIKNKRADLDEFMKKTEEIENKYKR